MRYDREHKARTKDRILDVAARAIRASGPDKVAVAAVMAEAGLTHGGFYAHFPSKDALISAAVGRMFDDATERNRLMREGADTSAALGAYIDAYLSRVHRDAPETGCPLPALSAELSRLGPAARGALGEGLTRMTDQLARRLAELTPAPADLRALSASMIAEMVGAMALARAVADPVQSDQILFSARAAVKAKAGLDPAMRRAT